MASLNRVELIGYLGRDPEMRYLPNGKAVVNTSIGVGYGSGEGATTEWVNLAAFEKTAEVVNQYASKGSLLYVEGRLQTRSWDGNDGVKHYRTEVVVNRVQLLDRRRQGSESSPTSADYTIPASDDLPF